MSTKVWLNPEWAGKSFRCVERILTVDADGILHGNISEAEAERLVKLGWVHLDGKSDAVKGPRLARLQALRKQAADAVSVAESTLKAARDKLSAIDNTIASAETDKKATPLEVLADNKKGGKRG